MRNLFHLKSKNPHQACAIYEGVCGCNENYIDETKGNVEIRWEEHSDINKIPESSKHLKNNPTHAFTWKVLMTALINDRVRKNPEGSFIDHHLISKLIRKSYFFWKRSYTTIFSFNL